MRDHRTVFSLDQMAYVLGVSKSGYYDFIKRPIGLRARENEELLKKAKDIFKESSDTYGSPRIHAELIDQGYPCSRPKVARLMKAHAIQAKMYKKFKKTTKQSEKPYHKGQDLIQRDFSAPTPNARWVADITFVSISSKWAYLAVILDLFSRKVVGMALRENMKTDLILEAFTAALIFRKPSAGVIHHSDLGSQYTSKAFYKMAQKYGVQLSHGATGCAYDNAAMESFFHTLKTELVYFKKYQTVEEATLDIFTYIYTFYNSKRRHSTLKYQSPNQYEQNYQQKQIISVPTV